MVFTAVPPGTYPPANIPLTELERPNRPLGFVAVVLPNSAEFPRVDMVIYSISGVDPLWKIPLVDEAHAEPA